MVVKKKGFGVQVEAHSYEEGVGVDGGWQGNPCIIAVPYQGTLNLVRSLRQSARLCRLPPQGRKNE